MSASSSRPISSPKNTRGTTSANRKRHGRRSAARLADPAGVAADDLSRLDGAADAGAGARPLAAAALDGDAAALLSPLLLSHSGPQGAPHRPPDCRAAGVVRI